jgi:hypothetical protein
MSIDEAFNKWYARQDHSGLPWQTSRDELFNVFFAGWSAKAEAIKQTDLFPGTWDKDGMDPERRDRTYGAAGKEIFPDLRPASLTGQKPGTCNAETSVQVGCGADSVTAEDIWNAWPVGYKTGRGAAIPAIKKAMKKAAPAALLAAVKELNSYFVQWPEAEKQYLPNPSTFFNQERWLDDRKRWQKGAAATSQFSKTY